MTMHHTADEARSCSCPMPQAGWSTGQCCTCKGEVSEYLWCASYPGRPEAPKSDDEIRAAIAAARASGLGASA